MYLRLRDSSSDFLPTTPAKTAGSSSRLHRGGTENDDEAKNGDDDEFREPGQERGRNIKDEKLRQQIDR